MEGSYPNHLISIPRSVVSLKHYFQVHDQPFTRSAIYLVLLALLVTVVGVVVGLASYFRDAPRKAEARAKTLAKKLAAVTFEDGKAKAEGEQPRVLWEELQPDARAPQAQHAGDAEAEPKRRAPRSLVLAVDTTGEGASLEKAAESAGCVLSQRIIVFGPSAVRSFARAAKPGEKDTEEAIPYAEADKLAKLRPLVEAGGGEMPEPKVENGVAKFDLEDRKIHVLVHSAELMLLVNTTAKDLGAEQAQWAAMRDDPAMGPPEFLVLVTDSGVLLKAFYEKAPRAWKFADHPDADAAAVAEWVASTARQVQAENLKRGLLPTVVQMMLFLCVELFFVALVSSIAGLIVNGATHAGLAYGELLTIAIYAVTPARLVLPILLAIAQIEASWMWVLPFAVGMAYAGLGTHHTSLALERAGAPAM